MFHISSEDNSGIFQITENEGSGDCLFLSLFEFLEQNRNHLENVPQDAHQVRLETVDYILSRNAIGYQLNWDRMYDSIKCNLETRIENLSKYGSNDKTDEEIKKAYREYMSNAGTCGTSSELSAAAELYGFCGYMVRCVTANEYTCYDFGLTGSENDCAKPVVFLLFTGSIEIGHFRLLQPLVSMSSVRTGKYELVDNTTKFKDDIHIKRVSVLNSISKGESVPTTQKAQTYSCDVCKQSFPTRRGLNVHRNCHAKEANATTAKQLNQRISKSSHHFTTKEQETLNKNSKAVLDSECNSWEKTFRDHENNEHFDAEAFDADVENFQKFLFKANQRLPGPQHPSVKFYRLRKQQKNRKLTSAQQSRSSNPQRTDAKTKQRRRDQYLYDLTQYWYYNQRKKSVRSVMTKGAMRQCKIRMDIVEAHFRKLFEKSNDKVLETYPQNERNENILLNEEVIRLQIKKIELDTSAGPDRILVRTLRQLNIAKSITSIANTMLRSSFVPQGFRNGKMILIDKEDDVHSLSNWRPITIFSVLRRIIEKALDSVLRAQIKINCNQRGFVNGIPGCHVNARLVNACLSNAKKFKKNCVTAFLDISKAFDKIGHSHISKSLKAKGVSDNLHDLIMNLLSNNYVEISVGMEKSNPIKINCGVPQGGPLSPILFNIAIDFLYEEICDSQFADNNGYKLSDEFDALCLSGFADDQAVTSKSEKSAIRTIDLIRICFAKIGLEVNPAKSQAIIIRNGILADDVLHLTDGSTIDGVKPDERIKYLGCSFNSELVFDNSCIEVFNENLEKLSTSSLLKPDQKLNIINQYIFPMLVYPLQAAPLNKIPSYITSGLDVMIRRTVKAIIGLPARTTDNLFYAPRKLRGLAMFCASWEVYLQHFAIATKLSKIDDGLFQSISQCPAEIESCIQALNVVGDSTKTLRAALRNESFEKWCKLKYHGSGVIHYKTCTTSNDFVYNKNSLSSSEWVAAIKLNVNYANLNGVPGVEGPSNLCRKCSRETETIAHVTGSCPSNNLLITNSHHKVKHRLTQLLQDKSFPCFEEVHGIDSDGQSRFSDIIAFDTKKKKAYIIDPTIRYETSGTEQDSKIVEEKSSIYEKCIPFYKEKYANSFEIQEWFVRGLWFGRRGTFGESVLKFFDEMKLDKSVLKTIGEDILSDTIHIINNHIYNN